MANQKKIPYDTTVRWFQENSPVPDKYEFLSDVFDENTGLLKEKYLLYLLQKHYVIKGPPVFYQPPAVEEAEVKEVKAPVPAVVPPLVRQKSYEDPRMPKMVRTVSLEEALFSAAQIESLRAKLPIAVVHAAQIIAEAVVKKTQTDIEQPGGS